MIRMTGASALAFFFTSIAQAQDAAPLRETCPDLSAEEIAEIEDFDGPYGETAIYARTYCVSITEAERRIETQLRGAIGPRTEPGPRPLPEAPDADIGTLQVTLREKEPETFAGLWIQQEPTYGVAVAFTRDAAETLAKYTDDPLYFAVERAGPTLIELRDTQRRIAKFLQTLDLGFWSASGDESEGIVNIELGFSADPLRDAAARGEIELPDYVVIKEPDPFPLPAPPNPAGESRVSGFPQFGYRTDRAIRTLVGVPDVPARLALEDGCLVVYPEGEERRVALWEQHMALDLSDPERVAIMERFQGSRIYADSDVVLMGLQPGEDTFPRVILGAGECAGPYRVIRGIVPRELWDREQREAAIARRVFELGSRAEAEADYAADRARIPALKAWRDATMAAQGDVVAQIWVDEDNGTAHVFHTAAAERESLVSAALRPFVTGQDVPRGADELEAARSATAEQLEVAGVEAKVEVDFFEGRVKVRPQDLVALARAATETPIAWPKLARIEADYVGPLFDPALPMRADPEAITYPLEAHPDFAAIRALVAETSFMMPEPPQPGQSEGEWIARLPSAAGSLQQTHTVVAYGYTLESIIALRRAGYDPITALHDMNGRQTVTKRALTASDVVIAEPIGFDVTDAGPDGYFSTVTWRVVETLLGQAAPGDVLRQRLASGERADEAGAIAYRQGMEEPFLLPGLPTSLETGTRWVLHLNDALYRHSAYVQGGEGAAREDGRWFVSVPWVPPARIDADGIARPVSNHPEPIALDELRARLQPIQRALGHASTERGK